MKPQYYTIIATAWIITIMNSKQYFNMACACAVVHLLCLVGYEINLLTKQKKESSEQLLRTLESVAMELIKQRK
jgi:hypothetical protein